MDTASDPGDDKANGELYAGDATGVVDVVSKPSSAPGALISWEELTESLRLLLSSFRWDKVVR